MSATAMQESVDRFYFRNGPCCAGCDHWRTISSLAGNCLKSAPVSGDDRMAMLGFYSSSIRLGAGHAITPREHHCGAFKDEFDWTSLPLPYRKRIGAPMTPSATEKET